MKKIVFTLIAMMTMTFAFAEGETSTKTNAVVEQDADKYEMNINVNSLNRTLSTDNQTAETVDYITKNFTDDMKKAGESNGSERDRLVKKAVNRNLSYMQSVLNNRQYREYVKLLDATLANRGLDK